MTETPKRRGRPPGSRNKSKTTYHPPYDDGAELAGVPDDEWAKVPASIESYTLGPVGVKVVVHMKTAMSAAGETQDADWPPGWPVPQLNDVVMLGPKRGGRVQWVEYHLDDQVIHLYVT